MTEEKICLHALHCIFGYEPAAGAALVQHAGSAREVFAMPEKERAALLGSNYLAMFKPDTLETSARLLEQVAEGGAAFVTREEEAYPPLLRECPDPPLGLYVKGSLDGLSERPCLAVVGTRDMSSYGRDWCAKLVAAMARCPVKPLIVSGLAIGIDAVAHTTALDMGLPTVAVMATGIDQVYPFRHGALADRIAAAPQSALLTDFPPGTSPVALHFLRRNRIIAGLSRATLLIESRIRGGGMNTARTAFGYDRDVFALPGRVDDVRSQGCNLLIRDKVAEAVTDPEDLVLRLGLGESRRRRKTDLAAVVSERCGHYPEAERERLVAAALLIRDNRDIAVDRLSAALGTSYAETATLTGILESEGIISVGLMQNCAVLGNL